LEALAVQAEQAEPQVARALLVVWIKFLPACRGDGGNENVTDMGISSFVASQQMQRHSLFPWQG